MEAVHVRVARRQRRHACTQRDAKRPVRSYFDIKRRARSHGRACRNTTVKSPAPISRPRDFVTAIATPPPHPASSHTASTQQPARSHRARSQFLYTCPRPRRLQRRPPPPFSPSSPVSLPFGLTSLHQTLQQPATSHPPLSPHPLNPLPQSTWQRTRSPSSARATGAYIRQ